MRSPFKIHFTQKQRVPLIITGLIVLLLGFLVFFNTEIKSVGQPINIGDFEPDVVEEPDLSGFCGDQIINSGEDCDGISVFGSCTDHDYFGAPYDGGTLGCTSSCEFDFSGCYVDLVGEPTNCLDTNQPDCNTCEDKNPCISSNNQLGMEYGACPFCEPSGPVCGNDQLDSEEYCDFDATGNVIWGIVPPTCQDEGFDGGVITCNPGTCQVDTSQCNMNAEICNDNIDNDGNGDIDCDDLTCENEAVCNQIAPQELLDNPNCGTGDYCKVITTNFDLNIDINTTRHGILIDANGITLDCQGHTIRRTGGSQKNGLTINNKNNVEIKNCVFERFNLGFTMLDSNGNILENNTFVENLWRGGRVQTSYQNTFIENTILGDDLNDKGLIITDSSHNIFSNNQITSFTEGGIRLQRGENNTISGNYLTTIGNDGIRLIDTDWNRILINQLSSIGDEGIQLGGSHFNTISQNIIDGTSDDSIWLLNSNNNTLDGNSISQSPNEGIQLRNSSFNTISNNQISDVATEGIEVATGTNNFISNNIITSAFGGIQLNSTTNNEIYSNQLCGLSQSFTCVGSPDSGNTGSFNFADGVDLCNDNTPTLAFYSCFETSQSTCNDGVDNDNDGLTDCQDFACEGQQCGTNKACIGGSCVSVTVAPPVANVPLIETPVKFTDYNSLFSFINTGVVVNGPGVCNDLCQAQGQVCGFAQGGQRTCSEISDKCTCYSIN